VAGKASTIGSARIEFFGKYILEEWGIGELYVATTKESCVPVSIVAVFAVERLSMASCARDSGTLKPS
jgi:hypothetical protein